jgi:hypothetical protein
MRTEFRVPCNTGTYSDTLTALGLAKLLRALGGDGIRIQRPPDSSYYLISSKTPIADASSTPFQSLFPRIVKKSKPTKSDDIDYDAEKAKRTRFLEWRKKVKTSNLPEGVPPEPPHPDFILMSSIVDSSANVTYTNTWEILEKGDVFGAYVEAALEGYTNFNGNPQQIEEFLAKTIPIKKKRETSGVQIFNPMAGSGINESKPNSVQLGRLSMLIPIEMLKFSGWWLGTVAAKPIISKDRRKNKDLKVFVIAPSDITDKILADVMNIFRGKFYIRNVGVVQTDICASLYLAEALLNHHNAVPKIRGRPSRIISGLHSAYFKKTNQLARAITNISFINLPEWLEVQDDEDRRFCIKILEEHRYIVTKLDESHGEAHNLLEQYRNFLSLNSLEIFLEFLVDYGAYAMSLLDKSKSDFDRPRWFLTNHLRRTFMGTDNETKNLSVILENPGFQSIAGAIRRSTRGALYAKKLGGDKTYEVRYGLAQELKRKAMYKNEFATALAGFISEYMTENLRAADRDKRQRPPVTTTDIEQVMGLMDSQDPETVAMLLIAYGYAKEPRDPDDANNDNNDNTTDTDENII